MATYDTRTTFGRRSFLQAAAASLVAAWPAARLLGEEAPTSIVPPIDARIQALVEDSAFAMQFRGSTAEECQRWQAEFAAKLRQLLGPHKPPQKWDCVLERRVEFSDYVREERVLAAAGLAPVPFYLLLPRGEPAKRPGILAIHGHGEFGHDAVVGIDDTPERQADIASQRYDYGRKLAQRGYVVAAPCLTPFGRRLGTPRRGDACTTTYLRLAYFGQLLMAENLRDILWTLDYLAGHDAVNHERLGCVGLSYGGRMTMLTTALEPRLRVAVIAGALNCLQERTASASVSGCQLIPSLLEYGDVPEIGSLIAPRPCMWQIGSRDKLLKPDWAQRASVRLERAYTALGAADQLHVDRFEGGHEWHGDGAYPVLDKALKGE